MLAIWPRVFSLTDKTMKNQRTISIAVNGELVQITANSTVADLLAQLKINTRAIAVEVNREIQSTNDFATFVLQENDILEVVTLVGGG